MNGYVPTCVGNLVVGDKVLLDLEHDITLNVCVSEIVGADCITTVEVSNNKAVKVGSTLVLLCGTVVLKALQ